ncbi:MAG: 5-formyltetrahydrofolate cyclo-ligase [Actinobacteria bacterium]|nr:5-formyltetrahydrofolate cyclo-ligase [Actinomycetota bacterium]
MRRAKRELRSRMRDDRAAIPEAARFQMASAAEERLLALPEVRNAGTVMAFSSFGSEISTKDIIARLLEIGRRVLLPYVDGRDLEAAEVTLEEPPRASGGGPAEPRRRTPVPPEAIDVVIVPGLAFDRSGFRLGYGGGHYDRFLRRLPDRSLRVGLAFHSQVVERVPRAPGDERLHLVVTDRETIDCRPVDS